MKSEEIYNIWKEKKSEIDIAGNFASEVIQQVRQYEQGKRECFVDIERFVEIISAHPLAKAATVAAGMLVGMVRVGFMLYTALGC